MGMTNLFVFVVLFYCVVAQEYYTRPSTSAICTVGDGAIRRSGFKHFSKFWPALSQCAEQSISDLKIITLVLSDGVVIDLRNFRVPGNVWYLEIISARNFFPDREGHTGLNAPILLTYNISFELPLSKLIMNGLVISAADFDLRLFTPAKNFSQEIALVDNIITHFICPLIQLDYMKYTPSLQKFLMLPSSTLIVKNVFEHIQVKDPKIGIFVINNDNKSIIEDNRLKYEV